MLKYIKFFAVFSLLVTLRTNCIETKLQKNETVLILHPLIFYPTDKKNISTILKKGLRSRKQLMKEGRADSIEYKFLSDKILFFYIDLIRLKPVYGEDKVWKFKNFKTDMRFVAIEVNPDTTYVYNSNWVRRSKVRRSKLTLSLFIKQLNKKKELEKSRVSGEIVIVSPYNAKPKIVSEFSHLLTMPNWNYNHEVCISKNIIPSGKLAYSRKRYLILHDQLITEFGGNVKKFLTIIENDIDKETTMKNAGELEKISSLRSLRPLRKIERTFFLSTQEMLQEVRKEPPGSREAISIIQPFNERLKDLIAKNEKEQS